MRKMLLVFLFLMFSAVVSSVAESITGVVLSTEDNTPLVGVNINSTDANVKIQTDEEGRFTITGVNSDINATFSHVGFNTRQDILLKRNTENIIRMLPATTVLNSIVVTANRYEKAAYKVTQPINAASREDIESKGYTIISDIVRNFPGVDMNDAGPFRARPVIRGLYGTRILVLVDGERLNDQRDIVDFAGVSMSLIDPNEIERVELVSGPSSVLYGSDAMGGVINIITQKNKFSEKPTPWVKYSGRYSTADRQSSNRTDVGLSSEKITFSAGIQYRKADRDYSLPGDFVRKMNESSSDSIYSVFRPGFYDSLNAVQGTSFSSDRLANSQARVNNYNAKFGYKIDNHNRINVNMGAFRASDIGYPGVPNDSTPFLFAWPNHDRDNFSVTYTGTSLSDKMAKLEVRAYYEKISKDFLTDFYDNISFPAGPGATGYIETSLSTTQVKKYGLNFQELYSLSDDATLTFGIDSWREEVSGDVTTVTRFEGFGPTPVYDTSLGASVPQNRWHAVGAYVVGETHLKKLEVNTGLRWDNYWVNTDKTLGYVDENDSLLATDDESYHAVNGSIGLLYPITDRFNAVANVGTAFRIPNVVERFFYGSASGRLTRPNPNIKPERAMTINLGLKAIYPQLNYSLIWFYSDYTDFSQLVSFGSDPVTMRPLWRFENVDDVTIYGFEGLIEGHLENGLYGSVGISYQHGENNTDNEPIFVSPIKSTLTAGYRQIKHGLMGEVTVRIAGNQDRVPFVTSLDDIPSKGYTVVNATVGVDIFENVKLSVSGNNLFDNVYSEPFNGRNPDNPLPEPGRNFIVTLNAGIGN